MNCEPGEDLSGADWLISLILELPGFELAVLAAWDSLAAGGSWLLAVGVGAAEGFLGRPRLFSGLGLMICPGG